MKDIVELLKSKELLNETNIVQEDAICEAEDSLSLRFSDEYKKYVSELGFAVYEDHELTGICKGKRLNVVDVTKTEREIAPDVPDDWYVIEQLNIEGIVIWQSSMGEIYQTTPNCEPKKICDSLSEYIESID